MVGWSELGRWVEEAAFVFVFIVGFVGDNPCCGRGLKLVNADLVNGPPTPAGLSDRHVASPVGAKHTHLAKSLAPFAEENG